jgi:hypothetical protein
MNRRMIAAGVVVVVLAVPPIGFGAVYWKISHPTVAMQTLPPALVALDTPDGKALLDGAEARADADVLLPLLQPQEKMSWCGVASSATVLSALEGARISQDAVFTERASAVRSFWKVTFGGMPLEDLAGILRAHDALVAVTHAADSDVERFREAIVRNLAEPRDFLIVNYTRAALSQGGTGHFSPVGAYDADTDRVLILDTAAFKFPPTWVPLGAMFTAMNTVDSDGGRTRGWAEISAGGSK